MTRTFGKDLTVGSIPRTLIRFAVPIFLGNLLSSGYAIINTIWVGQLLGGNAVAAVAVSFPVFLLMIALCAGATTATSVLVAQNYGARRDGEIQRVVDTSWTLAILLTVVITAAGLLGAGWLIDLMGTPPAVRPMAIGYLRLSFAGFASLYTSFLGMSTLRAIGNTRLPLLFVVLGTTLNAILDPLLILGLGPFPRMGLNGAATASLVSGAIAAATGFVYTMWKYRHSPIYPRRLALDPGLVRRIAGIGFPSFVQQSLFSFAMAVITSLVNRFGPDATASFGITGRIDTLVALPAMAVLTSVSTVTAQNLGAGKPERIPQVFRWGLVINTPVIALVSLVCFLAPGFVMRLFVHDPAIVAIGVGYFRYVGWGYVFLILPYVSNGVIIGSGKTAVTMMISFVSLCIVRLPLATWLSHTSLRLEGVWLAILIGFPINAALGYAYYLSGKWKRTAVLAQAGGGAKPGDGDDGGGSLMVG